jgi:hypothetical protein
MEFDPKVKTMPTINYANYALIGGTAWGGAQNVRVEDHVSSKLASLFYFPAHSRNVVVVAVENSVI